MRNSFFGIVIGLALFSACSSPEEKKVDTKVSLYIELKDSIDLDFLGSPILASTNPSGSRFAFFDYSSKKIILTDQEGEILDTISKQGDTPDSYGFMIDLPVIFRNDKFIQVGMNGIFVFSNEGRLIKKIYHPEDMGGAVFMSLIGKSSKIVEFEGVPFLIMNSIRSRDTYAGKQKFYDTYKAIELVNLETGETQDYGPFEEGSLFQNGKGFIQSDYLPSFAVNNGKLYLSHGGEPKVWVYKFSPDQSTLDTTLTLSIPKFFSIKGVDRKEIAEGTYSIHGGKAAIRNIFIQNGKILISYHPGLDPAKMEEGEKLWKEGKQEESELLYKKLQEETFPGILVYDEITLEYLGQLEFPEYVNQEGFLADGEFLYFQKSPNPEKEEDFLRIYKMKLVEK